MPKAAALTMVYNEPDFLPIWIAHYGKLVGLPNCLVVDHGTDDRSLNLPPAVRIIKLERSPHDDDKRADLISRIVSDLLAEYDAVIHADVDEIVFPDPRLYPSFAAYLKGNTSPVISAYGFELIQVPGLEPPIDLGRPILQQRQWARFTSPMCKPVLVRQPVNWTPGFHSVAAPIVFGGLFLFHLRWFDLAVALRRLARTRRQPWADPMAAPWQRASDENFKDIFAELSQYPLHESCSFFAYDPVLKAATDLVIASQIGRERELYKHSLEIYASELWRVPKSPENRLLEHDDFR